MSVSVPDDNVIFTTGKIQISVIIIDCPPLIISDTMCTKIPYDIFERINIGSIDNVPF